MGEIAEAMLSGFFCEGCGEFMDGEEPGYPRRCVACGGEATPGSGRRRRRRVGTLERRARLVSCRAFAMDDWAREHFRPCDQAGQHWQARFGRTTINFWPGPMKYSVGLDKAHPVRLPELKAVVQRIKQDFIDQQVKAIGGQP